MTEQERIVVSGTNAGAALCKALKLDENRVSRILLHAEADKPLFAHVTMLVNNEELEEVMCFLEPLERLDPLNTQQGSPLWTP
jgi:hypothetical protein